MYRRLLYSFLHSNALSYSKPKALLAMKWAVFFSIFLLVVTERETIRAFKGIDALLLPILIFNLFWTWQVYKEKDFPKTSILTGAYLEVVVVSGLIFVTHSIDWAFVYPYYLVVIYIAFLFGFAETLPLVLIITATHLSIFIDNGLSLWQMFLAGSLRVFPYLILSVVIGFAGQMVKLLEKSSLENEEIAQDLERRLRQLSVLYEINRSIRVSFNLENSIKSTLAQINSVFKLDESLVCINIESRQKNNSFACFTAKGRLDKKAPFYQPLIGKIKGIGEPVIINDLGQELYWNIEETSKAKSLIASPISSESEIFGFIVGVSYKPSQFAVEDLQLLIAISNEIAIFVQNFTLYQNLQKEKQFSVNLLESAGSIAVGMDIQGNITTFNQAASDITGYTKKEVLGKNWFECFVPGASAQDALQVAQALSEGNFPSRFENPLLSKDGNMRTISWNGTTIRDESAKIVGILMIGQDITERKLMEEEIIRRNKQLAAFGEVARVISGSLELQEVLNRSLQKTLSLIDADSGIVYILDSSKKTLQIAAYEGISPTLIENADNLKIGEGFAGRVAERGEPIIVDDISTDYRLTGATAVTHDGLKSLADIPLSSGGNIVGVLGVYRHNLRPFTIEEKDMLIVIGRAVAMAIQNTYLFQMEKVRIEQIDALYRSAKAILSRLELKNTLEALGEQARKALKAQYAMISLYNPQTNDMETKAIIGLENVDEEQMKQIRFKKGEGGPGWVLEKGEPLISEDMENDPRYVDRKPSVVKGVKLKALMSAPIKQKGNVIGAIDVANKMDQRVFDAGDLAFLVALADLAAIAIENAQLYEEARQKVDQLSLLYEVGQTLNSILDMEKLLEFVAFSVASLVGAESCTVMLLEPQTSELIVQAAKGPVFSGDIGYHFKIGEGIAGQAAACKQPVLVDDVSKDSRFSPAKHKELKIKSLLSVPMMVKDRVIGVVNVANKIQESGFDKEDVRMLSTIANEVAIALENVQLYRNMQDLYINTIQVLAKAIDARDPNMRYHSENVTAYAVAIAEEMGISNEETDAIRYASMLHDIGKIGIPEPILQKFESFNDEEYEYMKKHPEIGAIIIEPLKPLNEMVPLIQSHHENYDGSGYPYGLKGDEIPLGARIIRVADSFDAMLSSRPNRNSISVDSALAELRRCSGKQFDREVVEAFIRTKIWNRVLEVEGSKI